MGRMSSAKRFHERKYNELVSGRMSSLIGDVRSSLCNRCDYEEKVCLG
jgi:hypothetical protein